MNYKEIEVPVHYKLSGYCCPMCEICFGKFPTYQKYCHQCGQKIDWSEVKNEI